MAHVYHEAESRGRADHGWLLSRHTFSFADYHDPKRVHFGLLRVLNDDIVSPSMGFGTHPHENMEIVSIPLKGSLRHADSMGNKHVIRAGEVQVMSAGTGVTHSEYNNSDSEEVNFLQIWVFPREKNIPPRYGQKCFDPDERRNRFQLVVSPDAAHESIGINQDSWFSMSRLEKQTELTYRTHRPGTGVYFFLLEGEVEIDGRTLKRRDGLGVSERDEISISAGADAELLAIEVPLK